MQMTSPRIRAKVGISAAIAALAVAGCTIDTGESGSSSEELVSSGPVVVSGRVVESQPPERAVDPPIGDGASIRLYLYPGIAWTDRSTGLLRLPEPAASTTTGASGNSFKLRAEREALGPVRRGYVTATVIAYRVENASWFSRGYCARRVVKARFVPTHGHERWLGKDGRAISLTLDVSLTEAHLCFEPTLP
jgi:hypothetical protein